MTSPFPLSYEIELSASSKSDVEFAKILVTKDKALRDAFESAFKVRFDNTLVYEGSKVFVGYNVFEEDKKNVNDAFDILKKHFADGAYVNAAVVKMVADKIFNGIAINDNAIQKRPAPAPAYQANKAKQSGGSSSKNNRNHGSNNNSRNSFSASGASSGSRPSQAFNQSGSRPSYKNASTYVYEPRSEKQRLMAELIENNTLVFGMGPAGTGKTHVGVAKAIEAFIAGKTKRIVIARPALQAGEDLGFMKGDKNQKLEEYMRPIYDMLDKALGVNVYLRMIEDRTLDIVAVGQMRGRTFDDCYIILDEAQNCTKRQMYMALTRAGENVKMIVTGDPDPNQIDLPNIADSGLYWAAAKLEGKADIGLQYFAEEDVVRSDLVKTIVNTLGDDFKKNDFSIPAVKDTKKANGGPKA